jgi:glycosyltransferase involved in cell wall biosynthesis
MTKAADAFHEAGAIVSVVSTRSTSWAEQGDADIVRRRVNNWSWHAVDYRKESRLTHIKSGARQRAALAIAKGIGAGRVSLYVAGVARERVFPEVVRKAASLATDIVYGGGAGLAAAYFTARFLNVPFAIDLEDFHPGDQIDTPSGRLVQQLSERIEREVLPKASLRTAGSADIAQEYERVYGLECIPINNAFPIDESVRSGTNFEQPLRLYWFSQTIGSDRGLDDVIEALSIAGINAELHLQGVPIGSYLKSLRDRVISTAPKVSITHHDPCNPDEMVVESTRYDIGLSLERVKPTNRNLCLTNKALAYLAAGLALVMTDTAGQRRLRRDLGEGAFLYREGDVESLARHLTMWDRDRLALQQAKDAAFDAARRRWNWDNAEEKGKLVDAIAHALEIAR